MEAVEVEHMEEAIVVEATTEPVTVILKSRVSQSPMRHFKIMHIKLGHPVQCTMYMESSRITRYFLVAAKRVNAGQKLFMSNLLENY